jgi:putative ABC transport system permease protein
VWLEKGEERTGYILRGVDDGFAQHGGIPLSNWDHNALGPTEQEAWINLTLRPDLVFIDSSFALIDPNTGESINGITITIGESISLIDISNPGNSREVVVGGILSQSSNLFSAGIWMGGDIVEEQFGGVHTRIYVSTSPGVDASVLEESLSSDLAKDGVHSSVIEEEVLVILGLVFAILSIFQAYLALGLIVGIAGIGVVTFRSVSERAGEIGMLRALGWRRRSVMFSMLTEISWVSVLGMLNGAAVALAFHLALHGAIWEEQGVELILPWGTLISMLIGGWILVILATIIPVRRAMSITPAQALASSD